MLGLDFLVDNRTLELSDISFEPPTFLLHYYRIIGSFSIIANILGIYLILFKSGKFDNYRYYLLNFQLACTCTDLHITLIGQPFVLFPILAGFANGLLHRLFSVSFHVIMCILLIFVCWQLDSLCSCFFRKHQAITRLGGRFKANKCVYWLFISITYFYGFVCSMTFFFCKIDKQKQCDIIRSEYPIFLPKFLNMDDFELYEMNKTTIFAIFLMVFGCVLSSFVVAVLVIHSYIELSSAKKRMSKKTQLKHKNAVRSLILQYFTTFVGIVPEVILLLSAAIKYKYSQTLSIYMLMALSTHSLANSTVLMITYPEFRNYLLSKIGKKKKKPVIAQSASTVNII